MYDILNTLFWGLRRVFVVVNVAWEHVFCLVLSYFIPVYSTRCKPCEDSMLLNSYPFPPFGGPICPKLQSLTQKRNKKICLPSKPHLMQNPNNPTLDPHPLPKPLNLRPQNIRPQPRLAHQLLIRGGRQQIHPADRFQESRVFLDQALEVLVEELSEEPYAGSQRDGEFGVVVGQVGFVEEADVEEF